MASEKYLELLKDPRWQRKRLEAMSAADWSCSCCGSTDKTFNVHHKQYRHGAMPWEYELSELLVLCERCHEFLHIAKTGLLNIVNSSGMYVLHRIFGYAQTLSALEKERGTTIGPLFSSAEIDGACDAIRTPYFKCDDGDVMSLIPEGANEADISELSRLRDKAFEDAINDATSEYRNRGR